MAAGDESAFTELFKNYYNLLGVFILRLTESEQLAQEIVQDVFLKIWINRQALADVDCFKAYLIVVARNHAFNSLKQVAREKRRQKEWVNSVLQLAAYETDEPGTINTNDLIEKAVALLPPQQKKVYLLSRQDGLRQDEIAMELDISLETVKKHMVLALRFLKNHLRTHIGIFILSLLEFINY